MKTPPPPTTAQLAKSLGIPEAKLRELVANYRRKIPKR